MLGGVVLSLVFLLACAPASNAQSADVWVVHGIRGQDLNLSPDLPVDISVNGKGTLPGFTFGQIAGPLSLAPGQYEIKIAAANPQKPYSNPPLITAKVSFGLGEDVVVIAHLDAGGMPTASRFALDLTAPGFPFNRLIVHHTAAAPAVDAYLNRLDFIFPQNLRLANVTNGVQGTAIALAGWWELYLTPAGVPAPVYGPLYGPVLPNWIYTIFVVGSLKNNSLTIILLPLLPQ
jgi:hypothetical protein